MTMNVERVRAIFDRELQRMEAEMEPSDFIAWFEDLRDEVLGEQSDGDAGA